MNDLQSPSTSNAVDKQFVDIFTLNYGQTCLLVLVVTSVIALAVVNEPLPPPGSMTLSVLPNAGGQPPIDIRSDVVVAIRDDAGDQIASDEEPPPGTPAIACFGADGGTHYPVGVRGETDTMSVVLWLRDVHADRLTDAAYRAALRDGVRIALYPTTDAYDVQDAIRRGAPLGSRVVIVTLKADDGFVAVQSLEDLDLGETP